MNLKRLLIAAFLFFLTGCISSATVVLPPDSAQTKTRVNPESALLLGACPSISSSEGLVGVEIDLLIRSGPASSFMFGLNGEVGIFGSFSNAKKDSDYDFLVYAVGPKFAWRTGDRLFFTLDPSIILGNQERNYTVTSYQYYPVPRTILTSHSDRETIRGFQFGLGFLWMFPVHKQGFYLSAGIFARNDASSLFAGCVGLRGGLGFRL